MLKVSALTGSQVRSLATARDTYGLAVSLTNTTATFQDSSARHAVEAIDRAKNSMRADGYTVSETRPLAFVANKVARLAA